MKTLKDYNISIDNLELIKDDGMMWFINKENNKTIVFPTAEMLLNTIIEYNNKYEDNSYIQRIADNIRKLKQNFTLDKIATYAWDSIDSLYITDEEYDRMHKILNDNLYSLEGLYIDWKYHCFFNGIHREEFEKETIHKHIENTKNVEGSDITQSRYNDCIIIDKDAPEYYWFYSDNDEVTAELSEFMYVLTDKDKDEAREELKKLESTCEEYYSKDDYSIEEPIEASDCRYQTLTKMIALVLEEKIKASVWHYPTLTKMMTLVLEEILEKFPEEEKK